MKIIDPMLLDTFRSQCHCELCGRRKAVQPHHLWSRGMGGSSRLDIPENLIALCRDCHDRAHAGLVRRRALQLLVADRESVSVDYLEETVYRLRRTNLK